jgi:hypothetical protein
VRRLNVIPVNEPGLFNCRVVITGKELMPAAENSVAPHDVGSIISLVIHGLFRRLELAQ